jgi:hypothetical protein
MSQPFTAGDNLVFQLESGFGVIRVLAIDEEPAVWHVLIYEDFFPSVEAAEEAVEAPQSLQVARAHLALTARAFERTPAARLNHREVSEAELVAVREWRQGEPREIYDRSILLLLGMR